MKRFVFAMAAVALLVNAACASKPKKQFQRLAGEFVSPVHITKPVDQQSAVIGMTNMPEARLAREAEMAYATLALATAFREPPREALRRKAEEAPPAPSNQEVLLTEIRDLLKQR